LSHKPRRRRRNEEIRGKRGRGERKRKRKKKRSCNIFCKKTNLVRAFLVPRTLLGFFPTK